MGLEALKNTSKPFITDGGFETWMFFIEGFEAPEFAALVLMDDAAARAKMRTYFDRFLAMAEKANTGYVLDTNTWRGCLRWADALGVTEADMLRLSRDAVSFAKDIRADWRHRVDTILLNAVVGPAGDGYVVGEALSATELEDLHTPQIDLFAKEGVDMISAITMTNSAEAIGITRAAGKVGLPVVISFTVETDGRLPSGETLEEAILATDKATDGAPLYYMINCAHPDHFAETLTGGQGADWLARIGGVRANASRMSHAELDEAEELDDGNPEEFGSLYAPYVDLLPGLKVVGGCCGTDHRHVGCVSAHLHG